jgi:hypothetical protein
MVNIVPSQRSSYFRPNQGLSLPLILIVCFHIFNHSPVLIISTLSSEQGVMFYANGMAKASAGARKIIHGGSGLNGHNDSYGPGCTLFRALNDVTNSDPVEYTAAAFLEFHAVNQWCGFIFYSFIDCLFASLLLRSWTRRARMGRTVFSQLMNCIMLTFDVMSALKPRGLVHRSENWKLIFHWDSRRDTTCCIYPFVSL